MAGVHYVPTWFIPLLANIIQQTNSEIELALGGTIFVHAVASVSSPDFKLSLLFFILYLV